MDFSKKKFSLDGGDQSDSLERELTNKFINGELSFAEYSQQWSENNCAGDDENNSDDESDGGSKKVTENKSRRKRKAEDENVTKLRRIRRQLPPALLGLMGEANLRYVRGEKDLAEKMCYEIIRQVPTASEPFHTLAQIYEGDPEKSLQFSLLAAHLNPVDSEQWIRLAALSKEKGDLKQEVICYTRAINANPKYLPYHMKRIEVMKELEGKGLLSASFNLNSLQCYARMLNILPSTEGPTILSIAKTIARQYHTENKIYKAMLAMKKAYEKCSELFSLEDTNLYLELLLSQKMFEACLDILVAKGGVEIEAEVQTVQMEDGILEDITHIVSCTIPQSLPIDLRSKLAICLIHMKAYHLIENLIDALLQHEDADTAGDIFLDVEEALTAEERFEEALKLLKLLVSGSRFSLPAVWLKYAECLTALGREEEAIEPFKTVIQLAPAHLEARMKLATILKEKNRLDEALVALEQNEKTDILSTSLLYERCQIYKTLNNLDGYLKVGELLLSRHFFKIRTREEVAAFKSKDSFDILKPMREGRGEPVEDVDEIVFDENTNQLSLQMEWELLWELINISNKLKKFIIMERLTFSALGSKRFLPYRNMLEFSCLLACIHNRDYYYAFYLIKDFLCRSPEKPRIWNLFNLAVQRLDYTRSNKFLMRFLLRLGNCDRSFYILHGNNCLVAGSYKYSLKEYIGCYEEKETPLTAMLIGIILTHMACQKFSSNKHTLVVHSIAFLTYYEKLRGPDGKQEVYYNIGRAFHQIGLIHKAVQYYKMALNIETDIMKENPEVFDLKKEIAFNLHLIYRNDAPELAQMYLEKYIVI